MVQPELSDVTLVEKFNENLSVKYVTMSMKEHILLKDRDFVFLHFQEIIPEENFGIVGFMSMDRPDVPPKKGYVRGEIGIFGFSE